MKKILSWLLITAMLIPTFGSMAFAEEAVTAEPAEAVEEVKIAEPSDEDLRKAYNEEIRAELSEELALLSYLDVYKADTTTDFKMAVPKHEFASAVLKLFKYLPNNMAEVTFPDVDKSAPYYSDLVSAYLYGIVEGDEYGNIHAESGVSINAAAKMLVSGVGSYCKDVGYALGGWNGGFMALASRMNAFDNVKTEDGNLTYAGMVKTLHNILFAKGYSVALNGVDIVKDEEILLVRLYDIQRYKGIVTATQYSNALAGIENAGVVEIDGVEYTLADDVEFDDTDMLGRSVYYYLRGENTASDVELVIAAEMTNKNKTFELTAEQIQNDTTKQKVVYRETEDSKKKTLKIDEEATYYYNGQVCYAMTDDDMKPELGRMTVLDNDGDGRYEYIFVYVYEEYVIDMSARGKLNDKYMGWTMYIDPDEDKYRIYRNGIEITTDAIGEWDTIRIMEFKTEPRGVIEVGSDEISGTIDNIDMAEEEMTIDGVVYKISKVYLDALETDSFYVKVPERGYSAIFALDGDGAITGIKTMKAGEYEYAYLIRMFHDAENGVVSARMYCMYGKMNKYNFAETVKIKNTDGTTIKYETRDGIPDVLVNADGDTIDQLIQYKMNSKGEVKEIKLAVNAKAEGYNDEEFSLDYSWSGSGQFPTDSLEYTICGYRVSDQVITPLFYIPVDIYDYENYQFFDARANFSTYSKDATVEIYDSERYTPEFAYSRAGAIVCYMRPTTLGTSANPYHLGWVSAVEDYVVSKVVETIDENDEPTVVIEAYYMQSTRNPYPVTLQFADPNYNVDTQNYYGSVGKSYTDIKPGDVLRVRYDHEGAEDRKIVAFYIVANVDDYADPDTYYVRTSEWTTEAGHTVPLHSYRRVIKGRVIYTNGDECIVKSVDRDGMEYYYAFAGGRHQAQTYIYDVETGLITVGSRQQIVKGDLLVSIGSYGQMWRTTILVKE